MRKIQFNPTDVVLDEGVLFGRGIFETILVKQNPVFYEEHIRRLNRGIKLLNLGEKIDHANLRLFFRKNKVFNCVVKVVVTNSNVIITKRKFMYTKEDYKNGFKVKISKVKRNSSSPLTYIKSTNYMENILESEKCKEEGYDEVIFFNEDGYLSEGSKTNIFIVKGKRIYTPSLNSGLLPGVVRNYIISEMNCIEKKITLNDLKCADEVFLTNSLLGVMKVVNIDDASFSSNKIIEVVSDKYFGYIEETGR